MGLLDEATNFFSGGKQKGAQDLHKNLQQAQEMMKNYYGQGMDELQPLEKMGLSQMPFLQNMEQQQFQQGQGQFQHPGQSYNQMMEGYQESPAAQLRKQQMQNTLQNQAQASGMSGSTDFMNDMASHMNKLIESDQQQYFQKMMGLQDRGQHQMEDASQIGSHLFDTGANAIGTHAQDFLSLGNRLAQLQGGIGTAQARGDQAHAQGVGNMIGAGLDLASTI